MPTTTTTTGRPTEMFLAARTIIRNAPAEYFRPSHFEGTIDKKELTELHKSRRRVRSQREPDCFKRRMVDFQLKREFVLGALQRRTYKPFIKPQIGSSINQWERFVSEYINTTTYAEMLAGQRKAYHDIRRMIGAFWHEQENRQISRRVNADGKFIKRPKAEKDSLPLYACSGELEANRMRNDRIHKLSRGNSHEERGAAIWEYSPSLNFERDGGGQPETQFLITEPLTRLVCKLVAELGPQKKNGGHIHINCQGKADIGERVFHAYRLHMSWMRFLVGPVRRRNHWSPVMSCSCSSCRHSSRHSQGIQPSFAEAKNVKRAAVSLNTWDRTGTVEIRLWGTTSNPSEWLGRRDLMQALARWSENNPSRRPDGTNYPITQAVGSMSWDMFFSWAAQAAPKGLAYALRTLRRKARSSRNNVDAQAARSLMIQWESSNLTCQGYRCRQRITPTTTTAQQA